MNNLRKSILITGASSGIGKYMTEILAKRGWIIWAGYRDEKGKNELLKIKSEKIYPLEIDVTNNQLIIEAKKIIENSGFTLNAIFNNAGIAIGGPVEILNIEDVKKVYEVNFFGLIRIIQVFLPLLRQSQGRIINMSSIGGLIAAQIGRAHV